MANEVSASASLTISASGQGANLSGNLASDLSGSLIFENVQSIATSNTQVSLGGLTANIQLAIKNLDATNYVQISLDNAQANVISRIKANGIMLVELETVTLYAKANTGACLIAVCACKI